MQPSRPALHLVRAVATQQGPSALANSVDAQMQRAIDLMQAELAKRWTVTALARKVGLSRPVFARRFVQHTGLSPRRYLTRLRMERAAALLGECSAASLRALAAQVGYSSEFAFNRAFRRHHQIPPGSYRRAACTSDRPVFRLAA
jgi:transcriptional regulator GlxA family with amidase domain